MKRAECYEVPKHHARLWGEYDGAEKDRVARVGDEKAAGFSEAFMPELFHRLYAEVPRETKKENRTRAAAVRERLHSLASELPEFETLRKQTVRDPLWAGMATAALAESVTGAMSSPDDSPTDADRARDILDGIQTLQDSERDASEGPIPDSWGRHEKKARDVCDAAENAVEGEASGLDESKIRQALRRAVETAQDRIDQANAAMTALGWGTEPGQSSQARDPGVAIELAKRVRSSEKLAKIIELAGRLTLTARAKRAARNEYARSEVVGVEKTGDFSRLLGSELAILADPVLGDDLLIRVIEKRALGYKMAGKEKEAKGPIVILIDQSGSMSEGHKDPWAKAVALALLDAARAEKRAFGIVLYDHGVRDARIFADPSRVDPVSLLDMLSYSPTGGTEFSSPMRQALDWIEGVRGSEANAKKLLGKADVVHVTDGDASANGATDARARALKIGAHIYGIAIGSVGAGLQAWSDEVTSITDVSADSKAVDLVFDHV